MIIPAILKKDFNEIKEEVAQVEGAAKLIQVDICDGKFVKTKTFTDIKKLDEIKTNAQFEVHLMVENPLEFLDAGKIEKVSHMVTQIESQDTNSFLKKAKELGYKVGLSLNPETPIEELAKYMKHLDYVQFMTVVPGEQGKEFETSVLDKITIFRQTAPDILIQVDGGIDEYFLAEVLEAGAKNVVVGSQIFQTPLQSLKHFQEAATDTREHGHEIRHRIKKIGFFGGAGWKPEDEAYIEAFETAKLLSANGYEIVNGGGPGVMRAATEGAKASGGRVLAVTYYPPYKHKNYEGTDKSNKFDEEIVTTDYFDRTKVMLQNTDIHVIYNGGTGTISEFGMTWANSRIHEGHHKPIILYGKFWEHIVREFVEHLFIRPGEEELINIVETPEEVLKFIEEWNRGI